MTRGNSYGDGSIQKLGPNHWLVQVDFGKLPNGKRDRQSRKVRGPRSEAVKARRELIAKRDSGLDARGGKMPFADFARYWLKMREDSGRYAARTLTHSAAIVGILIEHVGDVRLDKITPALVDSTLADIKAARGIGGTSLKGYFTQWNMILGKAVRYGYIAKNPCADAERPKADKSKRTALTLEEARRVVMLLESDFDALLNEREAMEARRDARGASGQRMQLVGLCKPGALVALRLELCNGLRGEEAFGLTWGAVDLEAQTLAVVAALDMDATLKDTKNESSTRTVYLDNATTAMLKRWKAAQCMELARLGMEQGDDTPVSCSNTGGFVDDHNARKYCRSWLKEHGVTDKAGQPATPHELRHTWATLAIASGADVKTVMELGGYASPDILLDVYAHTIEENKRKAARAIGETLGPRPQGDGPKRTALNVVFTRKNAEDGNRMAT